MTEIQPVLIAGQWRRAKSASGTFQADNPRTREPLAEQYPISGWADIDAALEAAEGAAEILRETPGDRIAQFLERFAERIEQRQEELVEMAFNETALAKSPRLADVELPRTTSQLRQAAAAARDGSWAMPTIDTKANIRSVLVPMGPVCVFGPNNFPFAFNSIAGGDFAAALAAGNPVIAKANSSHPGTSRLLAEEAATAEHECNLPPGTVQLLYRTSHEDGERLVADPRVGATAYTGSRRAGLKLKAAADAAGKPIYLELSSINPVVVLPGALEERGGEIAEQFTTSCLMGTGQFCTNPGMVLLLRGDASRSFIETIADKFRSTPPGTLLSKGVAESFTQSIDKLQQAGARRLTGQDGSAGQGYSVPNTLLHVDGATFLQRPHELQSEAFGNESLFVEAADVGQLCEIVDHLEGNLTGCIYSHTADKDDVLYEQIAPRLARKVGRLLNDKMPTGVAVSAAMNHGGPYPATGHPGFTAVGIPAALRRFAMLQCFDAVRPHRLPAALQDQNPTGHTWRMIDGQWTQADVGR